MLRRSRHLLNIYDAIIIGGGLSGIFAAQTLKQAGVNNILVLEANNRLGGRIQSMKAGENDSSTSARVVVELGAAFVGNGQHRMFNLIDKFNLETVSTEHGSATSEDEQQKATQGILITPGNSDKKVKSYTWNVKESAKPNNSFLVRADINNALRELEDMMKIVDVENPKTALPFDPLSGEDNDMYDTKQQMNRQNFEFDQITVADFIRGCCKTCQGGHFLLANFRVLLTQDPEQVSLLTLLWFMKSAGGFDALMAGEAFKVKGGNSQIIEKLAEEVSLSCIRTSCPVREISVDDEDSNIINVGYINDDNKNSAQQQQQQLVFEKTKHVIFAIPPPQISRINFTAPHEDLLPVERKIQLSSFKMGNVIKTFTFFNEPFWFKSSKNQNNGRALVSLPFSHDNVQKYPAADVYDVGDNCLLGFIDASDATYWAGKTKDERKDALVKQHRRVFATNSNTIPSVKDYAEKNWAEEPYIGGAFFGLPSGRTLSTYGRVWRDPLFGNRIFFAGTEAANQWSGYMEGALESGERAARCVIQQLSSNKHDDDSSSFNKTIDVPKPENNNNKWPDPVKTKISTDMPSPEYMRRMMSFFGIAFFGYFVLFEFYYSILMKETARITAENLASGERQQQAAMMMMHRQQQQRQQMMLQQQQQQQQQQRHQEKER